MPISSLAIATSKSTTSISICIHQATECLTSELSPRWLYTPRGCAILHVPERNQHLIHTTYPTSWGYHPPKEDAGQSTLTAASLPKGDSRFSELFAFVGTLDYAPIFCVPAALSFRRELCGGEAFIYEHMRGTVQRGATLLARRFGTEVMGEMGRETTEKDTHAVSGGSDAVSGGSDAVSGGSDAVSGGSDAARDCAIATVLLPINIVLSNQDVVETQNRRGSANCGRISVLAREVPRYLTWIRQVVQDDFNAGIMLHEYKGDIWMRLSGQIYLTIGDFEWLGDVLDNLFVRIDQGQGLQEQIAGAGPVGHETTE
jgi:hypothetical protein